MVPWSPCIIATLKCCILVLRCVHYTALQRCAAVQVLGITLPHHIKGTQSIGSIQPTPWVEWGMAVYAGLQLVNFLSTELWG
jgi:hypothetical protein